MWLQKSGKLFLICCLLLATTSVFSQEAIRNVQIEKVTPTQYRIRYQLKKGNNIDFNQVTAKIYRKRLGKVEEIFTDDITPFDFEKSGPLFSYHWITEAGMVREGDELQAKVILTYNKTVAVRPAPRGKRNVPPTANAGNFMEVRLPVTTPISLNGTKSFDSDGRIVQYNWKQIGGPGTVNITKKDSSKAFVTGPFVEGSYAFELTVKDQFGETAKDRIIIVVKPGEAVVITPPVKDELPIKKNPVITKPVVVYKEVTKLKGGPSNALLNLALPGLGHYYVSGDHYGNNRKPAAFIVTALYAGAVGGGVFYKLKSGKDYEKYTALANFREYQKDADGNIIGVRGGNEEEARRYLTSGKAAGDKAIILLGAGAGIMAADFVYTLMKGLRNKKNWKKEAGQAHLFMSSNGSQLTAGIQIKW